MYKVSLPLAKLRLQAYLFQHVTNAYVTNAYESCRASHQLFPVYVTILCDDR